MAEAVANGITALIFAAILVYGLWPWNMTGRRRHVTIKRGKRPWQ